MVYHTVLTLFFIVRVNSIIVSISVGCMMFCCKYIIHYIFFAYLGTSRLTYMVRFFLFLLFNMTKSLPLFCSESSRHVFLVHGIFVFAIQES